MTSRPRRDRGRSRPALEEFPAVEVPRDVLEAARAERCAVAAADVVERFLLEAHGPAPDHREDRDRWEAWLEGTSGRALDLLAAGVLS